LVERKIKPQKYFLRDILDIFGMGRSNERSSPGSLPVSQHDFVERRGVALLSALDQLEVNQHAAPWLKVPASERLLAPSG